METPPAHNTPFKHKVACRLVEMTRFLSFHSAWRLSGVLATLFYPFGGRLKDTIKDNISRVYPHLTPSASEQLVRETYRHTLAFALEAGSVWIKPLEYGVKHIETVHGLELLQQAQASGQGVLILLPHLGNWEMANQFIAPRAEVVALFKPHQNAELNQHIYQARCRAGVTMMPTDRRGVSQILRHLKNGGVSVILPDQVPDSSGGIQAPFFGIEAATATLVPKLARSSGARLLGLVCARREDGQFDVHITKAPAAIGDPDLKVAATTMNTYIEELVNQYPAQYQWSYKRFKPA